MSDQLTGEVCFFCEVPLTKENRRKCIRCKEVFCTESTSMYISPEFSHLVGRGHDLPDEYICDGCETGITKNREKEAEKIIRGE